MSKRRSEAYATVGWLPSPAKRHQFEPEFLLDFNLA
jgi:hypothetical protein